MKPMYVRALLALALLVPLPAGAETLPPVDSLVARALEHAPGVAELRARIAAARERLRGAGALADPMLEFMVQDVGFPAWTVGEEEMSMAGPQLTQLVPFPGKRGGRRAVAAAELGMRERELDALRAMLARDVRALYAKAYALTREREALEAGREALAALAGSARDRYAAGAAESDALLAARLARHRLDERLDDLEVEEVALGTALWRLIGVERAVGSSARVPSLLPYTNGDSAAVRAAGADLAASPEVAMRAAGTRAAEAEARLARLERLPDFTLGAGVGFRGGFERVVTLRAGLELPLWSLGARAASARAAARTLDAARAAQHDALTAARAEDARLAAEAVRGERQVRRYRDEIVPATQLAFETARANYVAGRGELRMVLESFDALLEARTALARREAESFVTAAERARLAGATSLPATGEGDHR